MIEQILPALASGAKKAWEFVKSTATQKAQEQAEKHYNEARTGLPRMTYERNVREMLVRSSAELSDLHKKEIPSLIKTLRNVETMLAGEECLLLPSTRHNSLNFRVNRKHEILITPKQTEEGAKNASWSVNLITPRMGKNPEKRISVEVSGLKQNHNMKSVVLSPAGLAPYITAWMRDVNQEKYGTTTLTAASIADSFMSWPSRTYQEKRRWLSQNAVGYVFKDRLEDWQPAALLMEAPPPVLSAIMSDRIGQGADKLKELETYISKGLMEISTYPESIFKSVISGNMTKATEIEGNLLLIAEHLQSRCYENNDPLSKRLDVEPVPVDDLCLNFIKVVSRHSETLNKTLYGSSLDSNNRLITSYRVFAELTNDLNPDEKIWVFDNNVEWAKNEILQLIREQRSEYDGTDVGSLHMSLLADALDELQVDPAVFHNNDTPLAFCQKVLEEAISKIHTDFSEQKMALLSLHDTMQKEFSSDRLETQETLAIHQ